MQSMRLKTWRSISVAVAFSVAGLATFVPMAPAQAQVVRGLPDFTDLVDQVGPSVVNIRTLEKVKIGRAHV